MAVAFVEVRLGSSKIGFIVELAFILQASNSLISESPDLLECSMMSGIFILHLRQTIVHYFQMRIYIWTVVCTLQKIGTLNILSYSTAHSGTAATHASKTLHIPHILHTLLQLLSLNLKQFRHFTL